MDFLIWLIIVAVIVAKAVTKQEKQKGRSRQSVPNQPRKRSVPNQPKKQSVPNQPAYASGQSAVGNQKSDILQRATANVKENEGDRLEWEMERQSAGDRSMTEAHILTDAIDIENTSELMKTVNDLMVMGYQANLSFERDFLGEGLDMLGRYEIPDTLPE